ncbi:hypothetical protein [Cytobacillus purgationiresistens]|uniref:Uncharacterized protein n=1 Tax=Cytobacillus purgationiresistens TaxID=863449 RepID=A0ABU0ALE2_9BACI|nr:hypothetical protein [Cytobacillus purgationiresistens]MDQ0272080.1 hypothetical protein [Cytobacillus purgationiresistens]
MTKKEWGVTKKRIRVTKKDFWVTKKRFIVTKTVPWVLLSQCGAHEAEKEIREIQ